MGNFLDVLGAIAQPVSAVISGISNAFSTESANEQNYQIAKENRDWNEKMWNLNNQYNTPSAQIERLKEAGLNPNLMYGQGTTGNSGSPAHAASMPQMRPVNYMQGLIDVPDMMLKSEQAKLIRAQREKVENTTVSKEDYTRGFNMRTRQAQQAINESMERAQTFMQQAELLQQQNDWFGADRSAQWNSLHTQIEQRWKSLAQDAARIAIADFQAKTGRMLSKAQQSFYYQQAEYIMEKVVEARRENSIGDASKAGEILKRLSNGLQSYFDYKNKEFVNDKNLPQLIFDDVMRTIHEGANVIDSVVPF